MDSPHLTPKLKSGYLLTLVLGYFGYFENIEALLKLLSKRGNQFLLKNLEQLNYFCQERPKKRILFDRTMSTLTYQAPCDFIVDKLIIDFHNVYELSQQLSDFICKSKRFKEVEFRNLNGLFFLEDYLFDVLMKKTEYYSLSGEQLGNVLIKLQGHQHVKLKKITPSYNYLYHLPNLAPGNEQIIKSKSPQMNELSIPSSLTKHLLIPFMEQQDLEAIQSLTILHLSYSNYSNDTIPILKEFLSSMRFIKHLKICLLRDEFYQNLEIFAELKNLYSFHLGAGEFDFQILDSWTALRKLKLKTMPASINQSSFYHIGKLANIKIESWHVNSQTKNQFIEFSNILDSSQTLKVLKLHDLPQFGLKQFLQTNKSVSNLSYTVTNATIYKPLRQLSSQNNSSLKKLSLQYYPRKCESNISSDLLEFLTLSDLTNLEDLTLRGFQFEGENIIQTAFGNLFLDSNSRLKSARLLNSKFKQGSFKQLITLIAEQQCKLKKLKIEAYKRMDYEKSKVLSQALENNSTLQVLYLNFPFENMENLTVMLEGLNKNSSLSSFSFTLDPDIDNFSKITRGMLTQTICSFCQELKILKLRLNGYPWPQTPLLDQFNISLPQELANNLPNAQKIRVLIK